MRTEGEERSTSGCSRVGSAGLVQGVRLQEPGVRQRELRRTASETGRGLVSKLPELSFPSSGILKISHPLFEAKHWFSAYKDGPSTAAVRGIAASSGEWLET